MAKPKLITLYNFTPFQNQKVKEIEDAVKDGYNSLEVASITTSLSTYEYTLIDRRNYHIQNSTPYLTVMVHPEIETAPLEQIA